MSVSNPGISNGAAASAIIMPSWISRPGIRWASGVTHQLVASANGGCKTVQRRLPQDEWSVLIRDHIPAYISWEQWEANQQKLPENSTEFGSEAIGGSSLLAGQIYGGRCGAPMPVHYRDGIASFDCSLSRMHFGGENCQTFNARWLAHRWPTARRRRLTLRSRVD